MTERRCHACRAFYDSKLKACPDCGQQAHAYNSGLVLGRLNRHLYDMAGAAQAEKEYAQARGL